MEYEYEDIYYYNSRKYGEVDFIIESGFKVLPIEVKSGKAYYKHSALYKVMDIPNYELEQGIVLCNENLSEDGKVLNLPIYMIMFFEKIQSDIHEYILDISALLA